MTAFFRKLAAFVETLTCCGGNECGEFACFGDTCCARRGRRYSSFVDENGRDTRERVFLNDVGAEIEMGTAMYDSEPILQSDRRRRVATNPCFVSLTVVEGGVDESKAETSLERRSVATIAEFAAACRSAELATKQE